MSDRMIGVRVSVTRYIADEPIPGVVECELLDANGRRWNFVQKTAHVSAEIIDAESRYPRPGAIACEIVGRSQDSTGRETVLIDTECPWCVESVDGAVRFEVLPTALVEWDHGSVVERAWSGCA